MPVQDQNANTSSQVSKVRPLDELVIQVATDLMGVGHNQSLQAMNRVLDRLIEHFGVDDAFLRRHRPDRMSEMVTLRRPGQEKVEGLEKLREIPFDADPMMSATEYLAEPLLIYPENSSELQEKAKNDLGIDIHTIAAVPLLDDQQTVGVLGLVRFNDDRWGDDEVRTLFAIATMMAQFWNRLEAEKQLETKAHFDELTGLTNRVHLIEQVNDRAQTETDHSLFILDINNMKAINDGIGMSHGDRYLVEFSERLTSLVRSDSIVGRLSGDQFAIFIEGSDLSQSRKMAARLVDQLKSSIDVDGAKISRSISIGIAHSEKGSRSDDLFADASSALQSAKNDGHSSYRVFDHKMQMSATRRYELELALRRAIENREFVLHYQPAVDLASGKLFAVEALLRWHRPGATEVTPAGAFIEVAEESGLVVDIGDFVVDESVKQLALWQTTMPDLEMWVNISPAQLMSTNVADRFATAAKRYGTDLRRVCVEVTEHTMLSDLHAANGSINRLRAQGVKFALDDFGTGYSSLSQLRDLPVDMLKIDMSFVQGLGRSSHDHAIVDAAITLAAAFDLDTVGEGVETQDQLDRLLELGCSSGQGWLISKPMPLDEVERWFDQSTRVTSLATRPPVLES